MERVARSVTMGNHVTTSGDGGRDRTVVVRAFPGPPPVSALALINAVDSGAICFRHVTRDGVADLSGLARPRPQQAHAEAVEGWLAPDYFATHHLDVVLA